MTQTLVRIFSSWSLITQSFKSYLFNFQIAICGSLNEKCHSQACIFEHLVWDVMKPLGGGSLLEEAHHWWRTLRFYSLIPLPAGPLCFLFVDENVITQLPVLVTIPCFSWHDGHYPSETINHSKPVFLKLILVKVFYSSSREGS